MGFKGVYILRTCFPDESNVLGTESQINVLHVLLVRTESNKINLVLGMNTQEDKFIAAKSVYLENKLFVEFCITNWFLV